MLTGRILDWSDERRADLASMVQRLIARSGEPVIRQALRQAMRILGNQFVLGETIEAALANAEPEARLGYRFSFDMLGEAARTEDDAARYADRYAEAVSVIADFAGPPPARIEEALHHRPGLSVKLSALHPRYQPSQGARLKSELGKRLSGIAHAMREANCRSIDAEEADKLDLSLALMKPLSPIQLAGWAEAALPCRLTANVRSPWLIGLPRWPKPRAGASRCASSRAPIGTARSNGRKKRDSRATPCSRAR
jgi:RHH-type proline utilization regulon transcriptional repressor/proline dehydrogenase/delta 1-pyrroline-5-carboxylate dehydrogenase